MSVINVELATKLDGSETHMLAILVDSWGDKLVIPLHCEMKIEPADYFMPCAHCGNAVLECNFESGSDCCDRCTAGHNSGFVPETKINGLSNRARGTMLNMVLTQTLPEDIMTMEDRIKAARQEAEDAFWAVIVKHFPEATDGAFLMSDMEDIMLSWVQHWVDNNVPTPAWKDAEKTPEDWTEDMGLHYPGVWHMHHTGGGCMVVTSDNVAVAMEHRYLGITSECVVVYTDTFAEDSFLNVFEDSNCWSFGDNPTVLMNIIDESFGGNALWNTGHLFDDIMTIAKSGKC